MLRDRQIVLPSIARAAVGIILPASRACPLRVEHRSLVRNWEVRSTPVNGRRQVSPGGSLCQ